MTIFHPHQGASNLLQVVQNVQLIPPLHQKPEGICFFLFSNIHHTSLSPWCLLAKYISISAELEALSMMCSRLPRAFCHNVKDVLRRDLKMCIPRSSASVPHQLDGGLRFDEAKWIRKEPSDFRFLPHLPGLLTLCTATEMARFSHPRA